MLFVQSKTILIVANVSSVDLYNSISIDANQMLKRRSSTASSGHPNLGRCGHTNQSCGPRWSESANAGA